MRRTILWALLIVSAWAEPGSKILDDVLAKPGYWTQMCSARVMLAPREAAGNFPTHVPSLPLFGYERWTESKISADNFRRLRHQRSEVIAEIVSRLAVKARQEYWMILLDLNGIEALPALLRFEKQFKVHKLRADLDVRDSAHIQVLSVITALLKNEGVKGLEVLRPVYDQEQRDSIVAMSESFLKSTPPRHYRAAAGMTAQPLPR